MKHADIYSTNGTLLGEAEVEKTPDAALDGEWLHARFNPKMWLFTDKDKVPYTSTGDDEFLVKMEGGQFVLHQTISEMEAN